ncbi:hypothetical protein P0D72_07795 [Paraburkholderia sediminicola]|uniref:hypothetical protein n=1 Tax=Paraburkholderia TaxID=1822464 RepID=UPI0038B9F0B4
MTDTQGKRRNASAAQCQVHYSFELARDSSHIASTLTAATLNAAVNEVVDDFVQRHGKGELSIFLKLLAERLDAREKPVAASVVRHVDTFGTVPPLPQPAGKPRSSRHRKADIPTVSAMAPVDYLAEGADVHLLPPRAA